MAKVGEKYLFRGDRSGVFYGTLEEIEDRRVKIKNARNIYYWEGAARMEQLATEGSKNESSCKFTMFVDVIEIFDLIQIVKCTEKGIESLERVVEWKK